MPSAWLGVRGFVGGDADTVTGFTNLGAREYSPAVAVVPVPDSLVNPDDPQDLNAYAYASDSPAAFSDPSGAMPCITGGPCGSFQALEHYEDALNSPATQLSGISSAFQGDIGTINSDLYSAEQSIQFNTVGIIHDIPNIQHEQAKFSSEARGYLQQLTSIGHMSGLSANQDAEISELRSAINAELGALKTFNGSQVQNGDTKSLWAAANSAAAVGAAGSLINMAVQRGSYVVGDTSDSGETLTFYHGTSFYAATEVVEQQAFQVEGILARQEAAGTQATGYLYLTSQESTANYFSNAIYGKGQSGGPATLRIVVPKNQFEEFAAQNGIEIERPVDRMPGMTETEIPIGAASEELSSMALFSMEEDDG